MTTNPDEWPLSLDRVHAIVDHLIGDGSREGLILGDELNTAMGASARRRAARARAAAGSRYDDKDTL